MLIKKEEGSLKGLRNGILGPSISYLLFAYDNIFFTRGQGINEVSQP
jgi:hypothetical protein